MRSSLSFSGWVLVGVSELWTELLLLSLCLQSFCTDMICPSKTGSTQIFQKTLQYLFNSCVWTTHSPELMLWCICPDNGSTLLQKLCGRLSSFCSELVFCTEGLLDKSSVLFILQTWVRTVWAAPWARCPAVSLLLLRTTLMCSLRPGPEPCPNHARGKKSI